MLQIGVRALALVEVHRDDHEPLIRRPVLQQGPRDRAADPKVVLGQHRHLHAAGGRDRSGADPVGAVTEQVVPGAVVKDARALRAGALARRDVPGGPDEPVLVGATRRQGIQQRLGLPRRTRRVTAAPVCPAR
nr:hypothetical protein [Angustibacter aerolatus]